MSAFDWGADSTPLIGLHSQVKLNIIYEYVKAYILERASVFGMDRLCLNIVDGFAGGGKYRDAQGNLVLGSPLTIINAIEAAEREICASRTKSLKVEYKLYCYDYDVNAIDSLRSTLIDAGFQAELGSRIILERANFSQIAPRLINQLKTDGAKSIFLLDQLGYGFVSFDTLRKIFGDLDRPEVILNFGYEWLTGFVSEYTSLRRHLANLAVEPPDQSEYMRFMGGKFGSARFIQSFLLREFMKVAPFFTPFFIASRSVGPFRGSNLKYWLIHLAAHERANDVMKRVHWSVQNHSAHFMGIGLEMMGFDPDKIGAEYQPFLFGDPDRGAAGSALLDDIPRFLRPKDGWLTPDALWHLTCNGTTSTSQMQRDVLQALSGYGEIEVLGKGGGSKRGGQVFKGDLIRLSPQPAFYFMKRA